MQEFLVLNKALLPSFFFFPLHFLSSFVFLSLFFFFLLYVGTFKTLLFLGEGVTPILLGEPSSLRAPWLAQNFPQAHLPPALLSACGCSIHLPAWEHPGQQHMKHLC